MQPLVIQIHISPAQLAQCAMAAPAADPAADTAPTIPGTVYGGGLYYGRIRIDGQLYALVRASRVIGGEHDPAPWNDSTARVEGASSYNDGAANTRAMAAAGSKIAKWALAQVLNDFNDWYIPSQDELEIAYRNLKPGKSKNAGWGRSGMNMSAEPPTRPYTPDVPAQVSADNFQAGHVAALAEHWYWSSTQHAATSDYAWVQLFDDGGQDTNH